jgi:hypothetical protein
MTKPPETLGTQYANLTRSGSSLTSGAAAKRPPFAWTFVWPFWETALLPLEFLRLFAGILTV